MSVAVISKTGIHLMPTSEYRARHLLKAGKAVIERYSPIFTIRLTKREDGDTQPIEYANDTGNQHVGVSMKSEKYPRLKSSMKRVYVLDMDGNPLMPTRRFGKVRRMLKSGQAKVVSKVPFTIRLAYQIVRKDD